MKDNKVNKRRLVEIEYEIYHLIEDIKTVSQYCVNIGKDIENLNQRLLRLEKLILEPTEEYGNENENKMENIQEDNE